MDWNECKDKFIKDVEIDPGKIDSLRETAESRLNFFKNITVNEDNVSFIIEGYYEIIKELLTALLLSNGLRSKNHQCLISYFYNNYPDYEAEVNLISQMSYLRNRLDYYGELIEFNFYEKNKTEFEYIIKILNKLIEDKND